MTLHTISLEVAKQLTAVCREKGIEMPESYFIHINPFKVQGWRIDRIGIWGDKPNMHHGWYRAFTLGELMRMFQNIDSISDGAREDLECSIWDIHPEDAAALLLIELIKSGEITSLHVGA